MSLSAEDIMQLAGAGLSAEQMAIVARIVEKRDAADRERKERQAERKRRQRSRDIGGTVTGQSRDIGGTVTQKEPLSPTPPIQEKPIPPSPPKGGHSPHGFDDFWAMFPNKVGKGAAVKAFSAAIKRTDLETMLRGLAAYAAKQDDRPWCNPATWLNQDRWNDIPAQVVPLQRAASPPRNGNGKRNWIDALEAIENGTEQHQAPSRIGHVRPVPAIGRGR